MKKAIKQKLLNLVTFNPIDYCIKSSITIKHIDILKYVQKSAFESFILGETNLLEISSASGIAVFEDQLKSSRNADEFVEIVKNNGFSISDTRIRELKSNFDANKKKSISFYLDQMRSFKKQFISLNRVANNYFNDTTIWPLYLSYRFIKGKIGTNIAIKAPLIIYKVTIVEEGSKLYLKKLIDEKVVNEKIQVVMNKEYPSTTETTEELLDNVSFDEYIARFEKMIGYRIKISDNQFENFKNEDNKTIIDNYNKLEVENSALLGIFEPGGGALKEDLKKIIESDVDPFENQIDSEYKPNTYYEEKIIKDPTFIYEIGKPLNIYQKYAVASSLNQSTLIYGPPGTGKSEVISNIIANALVRGKSTLMVSEKKAALDVLTERMNSLSQFALYLFDSQHKDDFYKKIDNLNSLLGTQWYRESSKYSKSSSIEPIKFAKEELVFTKNFEDWYSEVLYLLKKHWNIEDYNDGIYKMDYIDYQNLKNELGDQICNEWLQPINIEGFGTTTLLSAFRKIYNGSNYSFSSIDVFFNEYLKFKKFVKKFNLLENNTSEELNKYLKHISNKIQSNTQLVEKLLLGGNKLFNNFEQYFEFTKNNNSKHLEEFVSKSYKEKKQFFTLLNSFLDFRTNILDKNIEYRELSTEQILKNIEICEEFINKYKKQLASEDWLSFLNKNSSKLQKFLEIYDAASQQDAEVLFAEFVINSNIIQKINDSTLNFKQIKLVGKESSTIIEMFKEYLKNINILKSDYVEDFIRFKDLFKYDVDFLQKLRTVQDIFSPTNQEIIKEWNWISLPFIKYLYLNPVLIFDLDKISPVMQKISSPITDDQFKKLKVVSMWNELVKENTIFYELRGVHLQDVIMQMRKESFRSCSIIEELIFKKYVNNLRSFLNKLSRDDKDEIANVLRIASSSSRPPIAQFVKRYYKALKQLFPIWVARPDNVADMIPLIENEFYYGIFDEASQISIERAYPLVYRCNIKVVSGDDKQLRPTSFFMNKLSSQDFEIDDFDAVESLLERAKVSWWNEYHLRNHYRSESKELIEFSNKFIYKNSLEIATKSTVHESGIEVYNVNGVWDQTNKQEAEKAISLLIDNYEKYKKILIITFNSKQSQLIENILFERKSKLPHELSEKIDNNDVVITNLENVQGNEGDLVILSVSYGKNPDGIIKSNFGPLILSGGSNRLNVAITRARQKMIVIKSIYGNQIRVNQQNENAVIFKKFIEYVDAIFEKKSIDAVNEIIADENVDVSIDTNGNENIGIEENVEVRENNVSDDLNFSSQIVKEIYSELLKVISDKYKIINDYKVGSKNIDLVVFNKETNVAIKAIIIEKWKTNRSIKEMIEDIDRQYFLEDRGYSTFRVKEFEWCIDRTKIVSKIKDSIMNTKTSNTIDYVLWQIDK